MPAPLRIRDYVIVRGTYKGYVEYLNKDNYVTVWFIVGKNTEILPKRNEEARQGDIFIINKERDIDRERELGSRS